MPVAGDMTTIPGFRCDTCLAKRKGRNSIAVCIAICARGPSFLPRSRPRSRTRTTPIADSEAMSRQLLLIACALSVTVAVIDDPLFISPAEVDLLITDVTAADLSAHVSKLFGHDYLSGADSPCWPIHGRLFERHRRIFISAPVAPRRAPHVVVNVFFIVDTGEAAAQCTLLGCVRHSEPAGSPCSANRVVSPNRAHTHNRSECAPTALAGSPFTFLSDQALRALSVALPTDSDRAWVTINGVTTIVHRSHAHFEAVNVLGSNYLDQLEARLTVDYGAETATIELGGLVDDATARASETARGSSDARTEL